MTQENSFLKIEKTKNHYNGINELLDNENFEKLRLVANENKEALTDSYSSLLGEIDFYAGLQSRGSGEKITYQEFMKSHPEIPEKYKNLTLERGNLKFTQSVRPNLEIEQNFLTQARKVCDGMFGEILIFITTLKDGTVQKEYAFSSKSDGVEKEELNDIIKNLKNEEENLSSVVLVHNHPNRHEKVKIHSQPIPGAEDIGFISTDSLSNLDVRTTNSLSEQFLNKIPIYIIAVSENGLTYEYKANTSEERDQD